VIGEEIGSYLILFSERETNLDHCLVRVSKV
jgi:hypothetical protein